MLLDQLEKWKSRFGPPGDGQLERLLAAAARRRFRDAASLIRLHETALFLRAYPRNPEVARLADAILFSFAGRVDGTCAAFEEPEISGIAGTSLSAVFSYEVARRLAARHPRNLEIAWDRYDGIDRLGPVLRRFLPLLGEDWPVEAHVPYRAVDLGGAAPGRKPTWRGCWSAWPLTPELFDTLDLPLTWHIGDTRTSRSRLRLPGRKLYCHQEPLLRRSDISLARELDGPPLPVRRLARPEARKILDLILDTSAMRYRELYGFSHPDEGGVYHADAGRGVEIFFFGVPPAWRLPLRAYHGGLFFKNGVPAGYVEAAFAVRARRGRLQPLLHLSRGRIRVAVCAAPAPVPPGSGGDLLLGRSLPDRPGESRSRGFRGVLVLPQAGVPSRRSESRRADGP